MNAAAGAFDGLNKYIRITDIDEESRCYIDENPVSPKGELDDKYLVRENDILFARTGVSTGKTYLYKKSDGKLYFAGFLIRISVNCDNNSTFVYNATLTDGYNRWVQLTSMRSGQPGINSQEYSSYKTYYPLLHEQNKIVSFLKKLDQRIEKQRQLVEALKSYKRGVTKAIFNPNSVYQNCAESWRLRKVSELLSYEQPQKYIVQTEHYSSNYATPVLTANKGFILGYTNETTGVYDKGDVVIYDDFTMDMKYVDFPFKVKSSTIKFLTAKPGNNLYFLFCLLQSLSLTPEGHQRSYISKVEQMNVFVPSVDEQSRIAGILKKVTVILERHEFALHKLEMLKAGLLNQLFI